MKICPNCGTPLEYKIEGKKIIWTCPVCGYTETEELKTPNQLRAGLTLKGETEKKGEGIIEEKYSFGAKTELVSCPKCGYSPVEYTYLQTRAADEPPVRLYRCPRCGYTWREY